MSPIEDDDSALETLLAAGAAPEDCDAFTAAVMRRVRAEASTIDAGAALAELQRRTAPSVHARRWTLAGTGAGALLAIGGFAVWPASSTLALDAGQMLALLTACVVGALTAAGHALHSDN